MNQVNLDPETLNVCVVEVQRGQLVELESICLKDLGYPLVQSSHFTHKEAELQRES